MTTLFSDDFEAGNLSAWTGTNGTIAAAGAAAHAGSFGCDANASDAFAYVDFSAPASQFVSFRSDVKIVSASGAGQFRILQISQGTIQIALLFYDNGVYKIRLRNADNTTQETTIAGIATGTWQELRLDYDWSPGQAFYVKVYVDGSLKATLTDATIAGGTIWQATRIFILTFEDVATGSGHLYFDNVIAQDTAPAGGTTYAETGGTSASAAPGTADVLVLSDAGGTFVASSPGTADVLVLSDAGGASASAAPGTADVATLVDAGSVVLALALGGLLEQESATVFLSGRVSAPARAGSVSSPASSAILREQST